MEHAANPVRVVLECGQTRTFAIALDWPGWCRSGRAPDSALHALLAYGPRYQRVLQVTTLGFQSPTGLAELRVVGQHRGDATTDFGAPSLSFADDHQPVLPAELQRWHDILNAVWQSFDQVTQAATGQVLSKGPRGGGRELDGIIDHVRMVEAGYLTSLGGKPNRAEQNRSGQPSLSIRHDILTTLTAAVHGEVPVRGPRGGARWTPRYFIRRLAWHELDHIWETEDRAGLPR